MKNFKIVFFLAALAGLLFATQTKAQALSPAFLAKKTVVLKFDATGGKATGTHNLTTLAGKAFTLPDNARVTRAYYEVQTTFTSSTDTATMSLGIPTDDAAGIKAAISIDGSGDPWDAGIYECIQTGTAATMSEKTTNRFRTIDLILTLEALTAGKFVLVLEYVVLE